MRGTVQKTLAMTYIFAEQAELISSTDERGAALAERLASGRVYSDIA